MTDVVNLNSIRSNSCDCNKPKKPSCGCHNPAPQPCYLSLDLSNLYFKVKNLFSELKSEWQRAEARSNLGVTDIIDLRLTETSTRSGGVNRWTMEISKGGSNRTYDFIVTNGQLGEVGPDGKSAYEIYKAHGGLLTEEAWIESLKGKSAYELYCETTTDYPVKTLPLWFASLKGETGDKGDPGLSAYDIYCETTTDDPIKTKPQWLLSLKGEPGDSGDGATIEKFEIVEFKEDTKSFLGQQLTGKMFIWRAFLSNGDHQDFWVPYATGGDSPVVPVGTPTFLYKLYSFTQKPKSSDLTQQLNTFQTEVYGRTKSQLVALGWQTSAPYIQNPGYDFVYMAVAVIEEGVTPDWSVIQLTGASGNDGTGGGGTNGQFTSVVFTRTDSDISSLRPSGGDYDNPIPNPRVQQVPDSDEWIEWSDGIPSGHADRCLWASSAVFKDESNFTPTWSAPRRMTDTLTYDVEFSTVELSPGTPKNKPENWFDPKTKEYGDGTSYTGNWTDVIWRAEREYHNGTWSEWVIMRIKGEKGNPGGGGGEGTQGLTGPILRMRGIWTSEECYVNQSTYTPDDPTELRFIDVVYYNGNYYMVKAGAQNADSIGVCGKEPSNESYWDPATWFDFAFISTLIADQISSRVIDVDEVRIHDRSTSGVDKIVAGMTSGKSIKNDENQDLETVTAGDVRIWAGTNINTLPHNSDGTYTLDVTQAPFRVTQEGDLFAEKADIEGTVLANVLRLGKDSFSVCETGENTIGRSLTSNTLTLPRLIGRKIQMFYLLTDAVNNNITVNTANSNDKLISFNSITQSMNTPTTSIEVLPKRLYLFFGIDHEWRICEVTLAPITAVATTTDGGIVDPSYYQANCIWSIEDYLIDVPNNTHKRLGIKGTMSLVVTNNYTSDITLHIADIPLNVSWTDTQNYQATYDIKLTTNGIVAPVGKTVSTSLTYDRENNPPVFNGNGFEVSLENFNNLGGLTDAIYNSGPTVSIVSENLGGFNTNTFLSFVGDALLHIYLYKFLLPLISATYHRAPGETMLNASNPNGNNNSNSGENIEESGDDGVITEVTDFYHYFKPALTVWSNKKVGFAYDSSGEFRDYDAKMYNSTRNYPIQVTFPASASIYFYIAGTVSGVEKVMYGGELMLSFHDSVSNSEVNLDNLLIKPNTNKIDYEFGFYDTPGESDDPASIHFRRYFSQSYVDGPGTAAQRFYGAFIFMWPKGKINNYDNPYIYGYSVVKHNVETTKTDFEATYTDIEPEQVSLPQIKAYKYVPRSTFSNLITLTQQNN